LLVNLTMHHHESVIVTRFCADSRGDQSPKWSGRLHTGHSTLYYTSQTDLCSQQHELLVYEPHKGVLVFNDVFQHQQID
jgi:hypothetical protein